MANKSHPFKYFISFTMIQIHQPTNTTTTTTTTATTSQGHKLEVDCSKQCQVGKPG